MMVTPKTPARLSPVRHRGIWGAAKKLLPAMVVEVTILLRTDGSSLAARQGRAGLNKRISRTILPLSLGGESAMGRNGDCCAGVKHLCFVSSNGSAGLEASQGAYCILEEFEGVTPAQVQAVKLLRDDLAPEERTALASAPPHVGGDVALLRFHLNPTPSVENIRQMLHCCSGCPCPLSLYTLSFFRFFCCG